MTTSSPALSIDIRAFYEAHGAIVSGKPTNSKEGKEYACSCPRCGGIDRASFWESGRFCCVRGCRAHASSPYWFLRDIKGFDHRQACQELDLDPQEAFSNSRSDMSPLPLFLLKNEPPSQKWMEQAAVFCRMAEKYLWSSKGETAR